MTVLLDTHALFWAVTEPALLSAAAVDVIADPTVTLLASAASAWEMAIKHRSGRWPEAAPLLRQYDRLVRQLGAEQLPLNSSDAITAGGLEWTHRDPFDRVLAAQAMSRGVPLVSRDPAFRGLPGLTVLW